MVRQILIRQVEAKGGRWHMNVLLTFRRLAHKAASIAIDYE